MIFPALSDLRTRCSNPSQSFWDGAGQLNTRKILIIANDEVLKSLNIACFILISYPLMLRSQSYAL